MRNYQNRTKYNFILALKLPLFFQFIYFLKQILIKNKPTYIMINTFNERIYVEYERKKNTQHWFSYFLIARKY